MDDFDRELLRRLRDLPVPPPSPGFAARALRVGRASAWRPAVGTAVAAALVAALALPVWLGTRDGAARVEEPRVVTVVSGDVQPVTFVLRSPRELAGVTIVLELPEGVEVAGHPARRELSWQTDLQAGVNRLDVPVIINSGSGGVMTADVSLGRDHKQIAVRIQARATPVPADGGAAAAGSPVSV